MRVVGIKGCGWGALLPAGIAIAAWLALYAAAVAHSHRFEDANPDLLPQGWLFRSRRYWPGDPRWIELKQQAFGVGPDGSLTTLPVLSIASLSYLAGSRLFRLCRAGVLARLCWTVVFGIAFVMAGHGGTGGVAVLLVLVLYYYLVRLAALLQTVQPPLGVAVLWLTNLFMLLFGWSGLFDPATNSARFSLPFATWKGRLPYYTLRFLSLRMICYGIDYLDAVAAGASSSDPAVQSQSLQPSDTAVSANRQSGAPLQNLATGGVGGALPLLTAAERAGGSSAADARASSCCRCSLQGETTVSLRQLTETSLPLEWYGMLHYVAYMAYPLLYATGPILGFNAFVWQCHEMRSSITALSHVLYWCRWMSLAFLWEVSQHFIYFTPWVFNDINQFASKFGCPFWEAIVIANFVVTKEWMTLLLLWRFSRGTALLDGIDTVENMPQCIHFQCSFANLWRIWHASLNRFLIRYVYTRMTLHRVLAVWPTFLFVAIWHDNAGAATFLNFTERGGAQKWYMWCLFNAAGVMLEGLAQVPSVKALIPFAEGSRMRWMLQVIAGALLTVAILAGNLTVPLALPMVWDFLAYIMFSTPFAIPMLLVLTGLTTIAALEREESDTSRRMRARAVPPPACSPPSC